METSIEQDDILRLIHIELDKLTMVVGLLRLHPLCSGNCLYCKEKRNG